MPLAKGECKVQVELFAVESSNLAGIGYDQAAEVLAVEFKPRSGRQKGPIFHYEGVKQAVFDDLVNAVSVGSFYARNIKGKYSAKRVTGPCSECQEEGPIGEWCQFPSLRRPGELCRGVYRELETRYNVTTAALLAVLL